MSTTAPDTVVLSLGADVRRHVTNIAGRLSLRVPQKQAVEILARVCEILPPRQGAVPDVTTARFRPGIGPTRAMFSGVVGAHLMYAPQRSQETRMRWPAPTGCHENLPLTGPW